MRAILVILSLLAIARAAELLPEDRGATGLWQNLKRLNSNVRVLYVTAHPDDEDAALLTYLSRGLGANVTMLILTHGEGGANVISGDFFEALGALRTLEMQRAAQYYGVQVRYTRAIDNGFSKNMAEALRQWKEADLLADVLQITREVKPQIIISRFNESPRDGHGHHQTAGRMARLAFRDSPDVLKLYTSNWRDGDPVTLKLDTGQYDAMLGRSYAQIGREGYRMHRSQGMSARTTPLGSVWSYLKLEASRVGEATAETSISDRLPGGFDNENEAALLRAFDALHPEASAPQLAHAWKKLPLRRTEIGIALAQALALELDANYIGGQVLQPGTAGKLNVKLHERGPSGVQKVTYGISGPMELGLRAADGSFSTRVKPDAPANARLQVTATFEYQGATVTLLRELDQVVGPAISVKFDADFGLLPMGKADYEVGVSVKNLSEFRQQGVLRLKGAEQQVFDLGSSGEEARLRFRVRVPPTAELLLEVEASVGPQTYKSSFVAITQPGFGAIYLRHAASHLLRVVDVKVASGLRIGYLMGSGDVVPEAMRQLGIDVELLTESALADGDLSKYTSIWLGIRAYAARQDLQKYNARLLDYVKNGGNLIVQYQTQEYDKNFAPYAYSQGRGSEEVSEEDARVTILAPDDRVFHSPNRIVPADFSGWVEQRGSKFFTTWAPEWTPLIETHDQGQAPQRGIWLSAPYGKGTYVYCALAWYRQLPFAVPGAARLVANLASLGK